jgi:SHS2 domain-containing protein
VYRWVDHTAEVELAIEAETERDVFADALAALAELLGFAGSEGGEELTLTATAPDRPALLAAWLEELVLLAESHGYVATRLHTLELADAALTAVVSGLFGEPPPLVKAVTYHGLTFERSGSRYVATVVLDV